MTPTEELRTTRLSASHGSFQDACEVKQLWHSYEGSFLLMKVPDARGANFLWNLCALGSAAPPARRAAASVNEPLSRFGPSSQRVSLAGGAGVPLRAPSVARRGSRAIVWRVSVRARCARRLRCLPAPTPSSRLRQRCRSVAPSCDGPSRSAIARTPLGARKPHARATRCRAALCRSACSDSF